MNQEKKCKTEGFNWGGGGGNEGEGTYILKADISG